MWALFLFSSYNPLEVFVMKNLPNYLISIHKVIAKQHGWNILLLLDLCLFQKACFYLYQPSRIFKCSSQVFVTFHSSMETFGNVPTFHL